MFALLGNILAGIVAWFGTFSASKAADVAVEVAKWIAFKGLVYLVLFTVVPVLLYNIFQDFIFDAITWGLQYIGASGFSGAGLTIQLTGFAGYIATVIGLPSMFSMFMTAIAIRFVLHLVRL